ncbi:MAG TPA: DNA-binding response regulator [Actinobacteria bacterium]|nr:DNA-binding response regulator [Actinomycetota bacterium]
MKVLIVDDHPVARRGLRTIASEAFGGVECAEAGDAATALIIATAFHPDLLLLDMHMPGEVTAATLCRRMRNALPDSTIVIVTAFDSSAEIRDCLLAGADGCLLKDTSETDVAAALRTAVTGEPALDSRIAFQLARDLANEPAHAAAPHLSGREKDVLHLLAEGCSNRAIARRLELSEATVKGHVSRLLDKLNATSRLEAVIRASDAGLI